MRIKGLNGNSYIVHYIHVYNFVQFFFLSNLQQQRKKRMERICGKRIGNNEIKKKGEKTHSSVKGCKLSRQTIVESVLASKCGFAC